MPAQFWKPHWARVADLVASVFVLLACEVLAESLCWALLAQRDLIFGKRRKMLIACAGARVCVRACVRMRACCVCTSALVQVYPSIHPSVHPFAIDRAERLSKRPKLAISSL